MMLSLYASGSVDSPESSDGLRYQRQGGKSRQRGFFFGFFQTRPFGQIWRRRCQNLVERWAATPNKKEELEFFRFSYR